MYFVLWMHVFKDHHCHSIKRNLKFVVFFLLTFVFKFSIVENSTVFNLFLIVLFGHQFIIITKIKLRKSLGSLKIFIKKLKIFKMWFKNNSNKLLVPNNKMGI